MKKILYTLLAGAMALVSCSKSDDAPTAPQSDATTFTLSVDGAATRTASTITPARYVMEVWSEDGTTAENVFGTGDDATNHTEITSGSAFTVTLDKTKAYTCLFWADDNTTFNAASLKAVGLNSGKEMAEAYHAKVAVAKGKNPAVAVTLKRAVAKITLTETDKVKNDANLALKLSNIYPTFNVLDAQATGTAAEWTKTIKPAATTGTIGTLYFFAKTDKELTELKFTYAAETEKTVSNVPYQMNYATNIKGEYSNVSSFTFTVTADDEWLSPDNEVVFPQPKVGDFYYSDNTFSSTIKSGKTCIGIVFVVNADGTTGKIVSLDEVTDTKWSTAEIDTGVTDDNNGAANTLKVFALGAYNATVYPAFGWCATKNATVPAGINWYIPAQLELIDEIYANKAPLNTSLAAASATELSGLRYWSSSTQTNANLACYVHLGTGSPHFGRKVNGYRVRVVSAF